MNKHWNNLKYLTRHKWFVFQAGLRTGAPIPALIIHDWSKLLPSEWFPYANYFFSKRAETAYFHDPGSNVEFDTAWLKHIHRNPHHWQYWILQNDEDGLRVLDMPLRYVKEMVADWMGAGKAQTGQWGVSEWYARNRDNIKISDKTRISVEAILYAVAFWDLARK